MKADNQITKVLFLLENNRSSVLAVFPELLENKKGSMVKCYSHMGQHATCSIDYYKDLKQANSVEYTGLHNELKSFGYTLEILNDDQFEPIKKAITSTGEGRTIIIYKDGGIKIFDQGLDWNNRAVVINIEPDTMQEILAALKAPN